MKPRTKLEKRVTGLSSKLSAVTEVQKNGRKNIYSPTKHIGARMSYGVPSAAEHG